VLYRKRENVRVMVRVRVGESIYDDQITVL